MAGQSSCRAKRMSNQYYRVDKFIVPTAVREEFIERILLIHEMLGAQPGFVSDLLLEQIAGPGKFNLVTVAIWEDASAAEAAGRVATARYRAEQFDPAAFIERLGITADMGTYAEIRAG